jgi:hypothetical protein
MEVLPAVANIVVCVELDGGQPTEATLTAVADARRVSEAIGASVFALLVAPAAAAASGQGGHYDEDQLAAAVGGAGADKLLLVEPGPGAAPTLDAWHSPLDLVIDRFAPRLFLLPAGPMGEALGPWLVGRTRAFLLPGAGLDVRAGNEAVPASVAACRAADTGEGPEAVDLAAAALPVVLTVAGRARPPLPGTRPAELAFLGPARA